MTHESSYSQLDLASYDASNDAFSHVSESQIIEKARDILAVRLTRLMCWPILAPFQSTW